MCSCEASFPVCVHEGTNCRHHTSEPDLPLDNHPRAPGYIWTGEGLCIARLYLAPEPAVKSTIRTVGTNFTLKSVWIWSAVTSFIGNLLNALSSTVNQPACVYSSEPAIALICYIWSLCTLFKWLCILYTAQVQCSTWCRPRTETGWRG